MPKKIKWSVKATKEWADILTYWKNRNKSNTYSLKLNRSLKQNIKSIAGMPDSGILTATQFLRVKIVNSYLVYYHIHADYIEILTIWDSRRNPEKFKL